VLKIKRKDILKIFFFIILSFCNSATFGLSENSWQIGGKIHFEEKSGVDYIGTVELNKIAKESVKEHFNIVSDSCTYNAKLLLKKEKDGFVVKHYEEKSRPGVGEEMHATLLYSEKRFDDGHETLLAVCNNLTQVDKSLSCTDAPTVEQVAAGYQKIIKPGWKFKISDVMFKVEKAGFTIFANLLFKDKDEILNESGNPVSGRFLHITLVNVDQSVVLDKLKIDQLVLKLRKKLRGKMVKISNINGQADLEFGVSGSSDRTRLTLGNQSTV